MIKAKIKQVDKEASPIRIVFDIVNKKGEVLINNQNCHFSKFILDQIIDKKQFIYRSINDIMKDLYRERIVASDVTVTDEEVKVGDEIQYDENQPSAESVLAPLLPPKIEEARQFLKMIDINQLNNITDIKVIINKILVIAGLK
jgi:hypothetical protein